MRIKQTNLAWQIMYPRPNKMGAKDDTHINKQMIDTQNSRKLKLGQLAQRNNLIKSYQGQKQYKDKSQSFHDYAVYSKKQMKQKINSLCLKYDKSSKYIRNARIRYAVQGQQEANICKVKRRAHQSRIQLQTIDVIKQQISKTLTKDLICLKSIQDSLITHKNKKSIHIKFVSSKIKNSKACFNVNSSIFSEKSEPIFMKDNEQQEKLKQQQVKPSAAETRSKKTAPLIYFLKKKQFTQRKKCQARSISLKPMTQRKKQFCFGFGQEQKNKANAKQQYCKAIEEFRQSQYSPWQATNPQKTSLGQPLDFINNY